MSAERLREAAALMRSRAEAAAEWITPHNDWWKEEGLYEALSAHVDSDELDRSTLLDAQHMAALTPAVALAVADLLDVVGAWVEEFGGLPEGGEMEIIGRRCIALADAYLGSAP